MARLQRPPGAEPTVLPAGPAPIRPPPLLAGIVKTLIEACGKHCPEALLNIISNPVNSTVPIAAETLTKMVRRRARRRSRARRPAGTAAPLPTPATSPHHPSTTKGVYDPRRVFGITTLDVVRAKTFYADKAGLPVEKVRVGAWVFVFWGGG